MAMAHHKRKRSRRQTVGCPCCSIMKDNSAKRTRPRDRPEEPERPRGGRNRRPRPHAILYRSRRAWGWSVWKRYRTEAERDKALAHLWRTSSRPESFREA